MNDIYATSMEGSYETRDGESVVERGSWIYRGYGNAEITLEARGERSDQGLSYIIETHSAETQLDRVGLAVWKDGEDDLKEVIRADIAGNMIDLVASGPDGRTHKGTLSIPDETVFDGPSPIWLIHLMIVDPVPDDRPVVAPVIRFGLRPDEALRGGFYRLERDGKKVTGTLLDEEGNEVDTEGEEVDTEGEEGDTTASGIEIHLADDGCPQTIRIGSLVTKVVRTAQF